MEKIKQTLWADYNDVSEKIKCITIKDEGYQTLLEERDKIRNELIKTEQSTTEMQIKKMQIEAENKRDVLRNVVTVGSLAVSAGLTLYGIITTFRFDQESTVTSTLGKGILNSVIPKMSKR